MGSLSIKRCTPKTPLSQSGKYLGILLYATGKWRHCKKQCCMVFNDPSTGQWVSNGFRIACLLLAGSFCDSTLQKTSFRSNGKL